DCPLNSRFVRPAPSTATLSLPGAASSLLKARPRVGCVSRTSKRFGDTSAAVTRRAPAAVERFAAPTDSALTPVKVWRMACQSVTSNASFGAFGTAGAYELSSSTKRDECGNGKGRKNAACASAYVDARAPVPTASDRIARTDNVGARRSERMPYSNRVSTLTPNRSAVGDVRSIQYTESPRVSRISLGEAPVIASVWPLVSTTA